MTGSGAGGQSSGSAPGSGGAMGGAGGAAASSSEAASTSMSSTAASGGGPPVLWVNEVHYDNTGTDSGEGIEIAGTAGLNLANYAFELHNGGGPALYNTVPLSGLIPDQQNGWGVVWFALPSNGLQNGPADGIALVDTTLNTTVQFLSYEGTLTAAEGIANGQTSVDLGASEDSSTPAGQSLQLSGMGRAYMSFSWQAPAPASPGQINPGQTFQ